MRRSLAIACSLVVVTLSLGPLARAEEFLGGGSICDDCPSFGQACCDDAEACCDNYSDYPRIFGMLRSDHCFDRFVSPLTNPFFFEDARSLTEVRGIFIDNSLPSGLGGGDAQVWAGQVRGRLTERFSVIVPRMGYLQVNQAAGGAPTGYLSTPVGGKYNFIRDVENQFLVTAGLTYFIPGSARAFSNFGDGDFHLFLTAGKQIFDYGHWLSATGFRLPANANYGTQLWYWSNQWDYEIAKGWYPLCGVNWFHWMRSSGLNSGSNVTGLDLINIPVQGVAGQNVVTGVAGLKYKPNPHVELGSGFEFPLTNRTDILHNRLYVDAIFRY